MTNVHLIIAQDRENDENFVLASYDENRVYPLLKELLSETFDRFYESSHELTLEELIDFFEACSWSFEHVETPIEE